MSKLSASRPVLLPALAAALACAGAMLAAAPAQAQSYYRPYASPPGYAAPPRFAPPPAYLPPGAYYRSPVGRPYAPPVMPRADMRPMLSSMGLSNISRPRSDGPFYVSEATDAVGRRVQVRVNAATGTIVSMRPIGPAVPVQRPSIQNPAPGLAVLPPRKPPLPPSPNAPLSASLPEAGASTPGGAQRPVDPLPSVIPPVAPPASGRANTSGNAATDKPAVAAVPPAAAALPAATPAQPGETAVRVIPGVAVPPNSATSATPAPAAATPATSPPGANAPAVTPAAASANPSAAAPKPNALEARAGVSTGAGAGAAEVPAGTASVVVREANDPPRPTPKPPVD